jgi:hypothetical protein
MSAVVSLPAIAYVLGPHRVSMKSETGKLLG